MLAIQTKNLPAESRQRLHPEFVENEQAYLRLRESLLPQYSGEWVAVHDGRVVVSGKDLLAVTRAAAAAGGHPYIALVGAEDAVVFRVRSISFAYDAAYQPFALPQVTATFSNHAETHAQTFANVIPDTGADVSMLPDSDCSAIDLFSSPCLTAVSSGVHSGTMTTVVYLGKVEMGGQRYDALIQSIPGGSERLVGRDVLNKQRVLFDGPAGQVILNP